MLTIEHGWLSLIDGLTVQRFFLHAYPFMLQSLNKEINPEEYTPGFNPVYKTIQDYARRFIKEDKDHTSLQFEGKTWLVFGDQNNGTISTFYDSLRLISQSGLFFIPELASGIIFLDHSKNTSTHFCIQFSPEFDAIDGAIHILSQSAGDLVDIFWNSYELDFKKPEYFSPWKGHLVNIRDLVLDIFRASIVVDFLDRTKISAKDVLYLERKRLQEIEYLLPEILQKINHMNMDDLINLYFPSEQRFIKYEKGKGAGQT